MCTICSGQMDQVKLEGFGQRMVDILNAGAMSLMLSLGHRTGLFDVLGTSEPLTSHELAQKAELSERYVREWLGAVTTGGIVAYDEQTHRFHLPAEHAAFLTRAAAPNNMAGSMQWFAVLAGVEDEVFEAFRHGRGVPYSSYRRFNEVMAEESAQTTLGGLDKFILPLVPELEAKLEAGIDVIDVGCGCGRALLHMAERFPRSRFTGIDLLEDAIEDARAEAEIRGLGNIRFKQQDAATWAEINGYDLIMTFDAIHDQSDPARVLKNIHDALRPGGTYLMQDIKAASSVSRNMHYPLAPFIYTISCMHCMSVALAGGGAGLGAAWGKELATTMLQEAGFPDVRVEELEYDAMNYYYIVQKA
jgi:2-polyprenyl-3-methyl-5-hydroxy-6-metoxy-1,4-benzoquinol methylase